MKKFWVFGAMAGVALVAIVAAGPRQTGSSENLLAKAQSEFAVKARNELIQRQMVHIAATSAAPAAAHLSGIAASRKASSEPLARDSGRRILSAQDLEALRARSPELAAAMARYM